MDADGGVTYRRGRVVRLVLDRGFGFIRDDQGTREYFFHRKNCAPDCPFSELESKDDRQRRQGTHVQFEVEQDEQQRWRAVNVELV